MPPVSHPLNPMVCWIGHVHLRRKKPRVVVRFFVCVHDNKEFFSPAASAPKQSFRIHPVMLLYSAPLFFPPNQVSLFLQ